MEELSRRYCGATAQLYQFEAEPWRSFSDDTAATLGSGAKPWRSFRDDIAERLRSSRISSGAVEERQRGEFWTHCQVQLLLAAIILTGIGRSRSFMLSNVKIISAADPVRLAFGMTIDKGQGHSLLE
jgi:hypothetical protein